MAVGNTLAYYDTATITTEKKFYNIGPLYALRWYQMIIGYQKEQNYDITIQIISPLGLCYKTFFCPWFTDFHNKRECLLDWAGKACQGQNTLAYYENS